jgi:predicted transcriptional regulator
MEFACKQIDIDEVVKCSLGLTRAEYRVFKRYMALKNEVTLSALSKKTGLDRTTVQKASLKLVEKGLLFRSQRNRPRGGYEFLYSIAGRSEIRSKVRDIVRSWWESVDGSLQYW